MRLSEASYDETDMAMGNASTSKDDEKLFVQFSIQPHHNRQKSAEMGRPIYDEREYVTIMVPGDKDNIIHRLATDLDKARFPQKYHAFVNKRSQQLESGTPLSAVAFLSAAQIKELEYFNCHTVEHLANLPDSNAQNFMGIHALKRMAQDFLKAASEQAPLTAMRAEMEKKDEQLAAAMAAIEEQKKRIDDLVSRLSSEEVDER